MLVLAAPRCRKQGPEDSCCDGQPAVPWPRSARQLVAGGQLSDIVWPVPVWPTTTSQHQVVTSRCQVRRENIWTPENICTPVSSCALCSSCHRSYVVWRRAVRWPAQLSVSPRLAAAGLLWHSSSSSFISANTSYRDVELSGSGLQRNIAACVTRSTQHVRCV